MPLALSSCSPAYRGVTKKMTMTALIFRPTAPATRPGRSSSSAPRRPPTTRPSAPSSSATSLAIGLALGLRFYLQWTNARRVREEGFVGSAGSAGAAGGGKVVTSDGEAKDVSDMVNEVQLTSEDYEDVTDWKTVGFRYRY